MKIYLVSTKDKVYYDEFDAIVVIAESEEDAVIIAQEICYNFGNNLTISDIGIAHDNQVRGQVLSSFNAS
jgi:hypothetical protein